MPEVNSIFPQGEAKKVIEVGNAIKQADDALLKYTKDADALIQMLQKQGLTVEQLNKAQTKANETVIKITQTNDKLKKSEETLSRLEKERIKIRQQQKEVLTKNIAAEEKSYKILQKGREALKNKNREIRLSIKAEQALKGSYDAISAALSQNLIKYKKLTAAERENSSAGKGLEKTIKRQRAELSKLDQRLGNHTRNVGNYKSAIAGSARSLLGAFGLVGGVAMFANVMKGAFGTIRSFTKENAVLAGVLGTTREEVSQLTDQAVQLGSVYPVTASEVTKLQVSYSRLGFTQSEIINLTEATIQGSIALNSSLDQTATLVGAVVKAFNNLGTEDSGQIIDVLTKATQRSSLSFESLETALPKVAAAANALNIDLETVSAQLGVAQDATLDASISGTSLRNIYLELSKRGLSLEDALGKINNSSNRLNTSFELFGKRGAIVGLALADNIDKTAELEKELRNAGGTAQRVAEEQIDTLDGSLKNVSSSWEKLVLSFRNSEGVLKNVANGFAEILDIASDTDATFLEKAAAIIGGDAGKLVKTRINARRQILDFVKEANAEEVENYIATNQKAADKGDEFSKKIIEAAKTRSEQLVKQEEDRIKREENALKKAELERLAIQREAAEKAAKEKQKIEKKNNEDLLEIRNELEEESRKIKGKRAEDEIKAGEELIEADIARTEEQVEIEKSGIEEIDRLRAEKRQKEQEEEKAELQRKAELYQQFTNIIADSFFDFAQGNKDALKEGAKAIIITALDVLKAQTQVAIVGATIQSLVQPDSIATFGASGLARAAILTGLIEAAFAGVQGLVAGFAEGTDNAPGRFVAGEKGRELMMLRTGELMMVDKPTYFEGNKYKGATIKSNPETEKIIAQSDKRGNFVFDDKGLRDDLKAVRRAIERRPVNVIDHKSGSVIGKQSGNYREIYLNKLRNGR